MNLVPSFRFDRREVSSSVFKIRNVQAQLTVGWEAYEFVEGRPRE